jgi:hypothetical protein
MPIEHPSVTNRDDKILDCDDYTPWCYACLKRMEFDFTDELLDAPPGSICVECLAFAAAIHPSLERQVSAGEGLQIVGGNILVGLSMEDVTRKSESLIAVASALIAEDPDGKRLDGVIQRTLSEVFNRKDSRRSRLNEMTRIKRIHFGAILDLNFHKEFRFPDGVQLNHKIAGVDVACLWETQAGGLSPAPR